MWQKHSVFPKVPRGFWRRFRRRWGKPLRELENVVSLSESLGANSTSPRFAAMDETYWAVLRSLHSRTCLHARSVLALLSIGLVDPAWAQWRICHETSTIAKFIAAKPEMAPRYMNYSLVKKYHLANELDRSAHNERPTKLELDELKTLAENVRNELKTAYGRKNISGDYGWSGLNGFRDIEAAVFHGKTWNPRGYFILASERVHAASNAGGPSDLGGSTQAFIVGPTNGGLTGPADLTSLSILDVTEALTLNAALTKADEETLEELADRSRMVGVMCWVRDPEVMCFDCGGYRDGASPPDGIPIADRLNPCSCRSRGST